MRLIDGDELLERVWRFGLGTREDIANLVKSMPTVSQKQGRWMPWDLTWGRSVYSCTNCNDAMEVPMEMGKPMFNYCPNCGARMEGEEDE